MDKADAVPSEMQDVSVHEEEEVPSLQLQVVTPTGEKIKITVRLQQNGFY